MRMCWHCTGRPTPPAPAAQSLLLPFPLAQPVLARELPPPAGRSRCWFLNFFTFVVIHEALLDLGTELGPGLGVSPPVLPCSLSSQLSHRMLEGILKECLGCR